MQVAWSISAVSRVIDLRVAEVPNPRPGDWIEIDGGAFLTQGEPVRDRERLVWTVDLRPARYWTSPRTSLL